MGIDMGVKFVPPLYRRFFLLLRNVYRKRHDSSNFRNASPIQKVKQRFKYKFFGYIGRRG